MVQKPDGWSLSEIESLKKIIKVKINHHRKKLPSYTDEDLEQEAYMAVFTSAENWEISDSNAAIPSWVWCSIETHFFKLAKKERLFSVEYNDQHINEACDDQTSVFIDAYFSSHDKSKKQLKQSTIQSSDNFLGGKYHNYTKGVLNKNCNQVDMSKNLTLTGGRVSQINKTVIEVFKPEKQNKALVVEENR